MNTAGFWLNGDASLAPLPHQDPRNTRGKHSYSLLRALASVSNPFGDRRGEWDVQPRGLEGEVDQELRKRYPHMKPQGFLAPSSREDTEEVRGLDTSTGSGAFGDVVFVPVVDALRAQTVVGAMGAQVRRLPVDSRGVGWIPRRKSTASVGWIAQGGDAPESSPQYDGLELNPKTVSATVPITRTMLRSAYTTEFERMVADDVANGIAVEIDRVSIAGLSGGIIPTGLLNVVGTQNVALDPNGAAPTRDALVELERLVGAANGDAAADARLGWIASPNARARLRKLDGSTAWSGAWVWSDDDRILGKPALASGNVPSNLTKGSGTNLSAIAYGDFSRILIGLFSPVDVFVDRVAQAVNGTVIVNVFQDVDVAILKPAAFGIIKDMVTS